LRERRETESARLTGSKYAARPHGSDLEARVPVVVEAAIRPRGPYSLKLTARTDSWKDALPDGRWAAARQLHDGTVLIRASDERSVEEARFLLALDDDTGEFHRRFARDPLLGPSVRVLQGLRPRRKATVAHATLKAVCGQLIQSSRAREIERAVVRACGEDPPTRAALARLSPAALCGCGLAASRAATLTRLARTLDLEALRNAPDTALARLRRERGVGPWSVGVIALQGLGRYDVGMVADLALVKLLASLRGRWPEPSETAELLDTYGEWQGLASVFLLAGFARALVPGASADRARLVRAAGRAA
jgi:3-methyladenine DNA glycosylase/8-oxoguanine DNA glycosylase